ncbi:iron donor protein CyaY [Shewanella marina]|uniref:iron donor protein CyaY n=1 Tax=Shewanella marina TaxID=487319 RepID=UPI00046FF498|nr:iron donor protein CyaY [Shewanella marina]
MAMTDSEFHQLADEIFSQIENAVEYAIDEQDADVDVDASGGVLQIEFADGSKIVINKQEPLHQIWLATRFGGYHYNYVDGQWIDDRSGEQFNQVVQNAITKQSGLIIKF